VNIVFETLMGSVVNRLRDLVDGVGVEGGVGGVTGRHHLEQRPPLFAADLTHDDVVGSLAQCRFEQVELVDVALLVVGERGAGDAGNPVALGKFDLAGIFDGDDLRARGDKQGNGVQRGRLPGRGTPAKIRLLWFSMASQRNAISSSEKVFQLMRSIGVKGTSLNWRMV